MADKTDSRPLLPSYDGDDDQEYLELGDIQALRIGRLEKSLRNTRIAVVAVLCGVVFCALALIVQEVPGPRRRVLLPSQRVFDAIPTRIITFQPDQAFQQGDPFAGATGPWIDLIPPGKGHIIVHDPQRLQLPPSWPVDKKHADGPAEYTISMFHQLHCLASLKSSFESLSAYKEGRPQPVSLHADRLHANHLNHCFDYLRQAIMCAGDTSLEKSMHVHGTLVRGVDGWGVQHMCRDFDWLFDYAAKHGRSNETGIA